MLDELDMIPVIVCASRATASDYKKREEPHLISLENTDEDIMNINVFGPKWNYQLQIKVSAFMALMKAEKILEGSE